jgi:hypothetical protein
MDPEFQKLIKNEYSSDFIGLKVHEIEIKAEQAWDLRS